ncbi:MAG: YcaO-like family protein [Thermoanaerobaculia bacterium]
MYTAKTFRAGTHRVRSPEETWERLRELLPRAGITRVADVTALDRTGIPVFQAVRPASRNLSVSQGKGATPEAARASAVMEAVELWHAEDLGHLPSAVLSAREMAYDNPIPMESLRWAVAGRPELSAALIPWVRARSFTADREGWLPRRMLELDFTASEELDLALFRPTSNGLASGNCREEALLHGLCELVERHALHLADHEPHRRVPLREDSLEEPWLREPVARIRAAGMKLALWDVTWEVGIPAVLADLAAPDIANVWRGSGCHPNPAVAVSRAVTEAAQSRLTYISGARDDLPLFGEPERAPAIFQAFEEPAATRRLEDLPDLSTASVAADLDAVVARLREHGLEPFQVDLTRPEAADAGFAVAVAFIPGLRDHVHA